MITLVFVRSQIFSIVCDFTMFALNRVKLTLFPSMIPQCFSGEILMTELALQRELLAGSLEVPANLHSEKLVLTVRAG
jgi:hypothetical protein